MPKKPGIPKFIEEERAKGSSDKEIAHKLLDAGWHMDIIHRALEGKPDSGAKPRPAAGRNRESFIDRARDAATTPVFAAGTLVILLLFALFI